MSSLPHAMQETQPPEAAESDLVSLEVQSALHLLQKSNAYAEDVGQDIWQFATEIGLLRKLGLSDSAMRWLLCRGEVLHADEITKICDSRRSFRALGMFTLTPTTCFISKPLNHTGQRFSSFGGQISIESCDCFPTPEPQKLTPFWDDIRHELLLGERVVKRFKHKSRNQEAILATFQEDGWPYRVFDPLSPIPDCDPKRRLNDTIKGLNHHQENALIRFRGDGTGEAVIWELTAGGKSNPTILEGLFR
jgi:hypothetical protein